MDTARQRSSREQALASVLSCLRCPHCAGELRLDDRSLACPSGHRYDIARQGYVSLPQPRASPHAGDSAEMVDAREKFLDAGHYAPVSDALARIAGVDLGVDLVVDLGAGTGYYLAQLQGSRRLALDASRPALRRAVARDPSIAAVVCDLWQPLPLRGGVADLAVCVFAPRNAPEFARILAPGGALVVVTPTVRHLAELGSLPGHLSVAADKQERLRSSLAPALTRSCSEIVEFEMRLPRALARLVVAMGPSARHVDSAELDRHLAALPATVSLTASVAVETFRAA